MNTNKMGLREAAELVGVSKDTVWRAVQRGELPAEFDHGPAGDQYWIAQNELEAWWANRRARRSRGSVTQSSQQEQTPTKPTNPVIESQGPHVIFAVDARPETDSAPPQFEVFEAHAAPASVPVEVHLQALRLVERAQLQLERAQSELRMTQNMLTEQADSLVEKEALARQAAALEEENQRNRSLWEQEKSTLLATLSERDSRVQWLEKRVPKWVRQVFGAG